MNQACQSYTTGVKNIKINNEINEEMKKMMKKIKTEDSEVEDRAKRTEINNNYKNK